MIFPHERTSVMDTLFTIFEIMGTLAFAISGALDAIRHKMDLFGVGMMGIVTATGGGMLRDIVIGQTPPRVFRNPRWAVMAFIAALITFSILKLYHKRLESRLSHLLEKLFLLSDTLGLAAFTVLGIESAGKGSGTLLLFVGVITGVGGGVMRDVFSGSVPSIFRRHIYALASAAGAVAHILLMRIIPEEAAMIAGFSLVVVIRLLAAHYRWNLPKIENIEEI